MTSTRSASDRKSGLGQTGLGDGGGFALAAGENVPDRRQYLVETGRSGDDQSADGQGVGTGTFEARNRQIRRFELPASMAQAAR